MLRRHNDTMEEKHYGNHETLVFEGSEADLHKHLIDCTKNPGHTKFIPVDTFTLNHLPEGHQDIDLYTRIKAVADLTVRMDVKLTSPHRPEFWPNTKVSYPFYNIRNKTNLRYGTGTVSKVDKYSDGDVDQSGIKHWKYTKCWCKQCQQSDTASHMWWEFLVYTATHVVFDDNEVSHTSLRLFYDRENSPVVSVDQVSITNLDVERDWCELTCVTCDQQVGEKLKRLWDNFFEICEKVNDSKYRKSRDADKLNFIVSHPHGCCKQVSFDHWVNKYTVNKVLKKFTYTTCTCPGSSGASVHCLGFSGMKWWTFQHVHSGSISSELNCSGSGIAN